MFGRQRPAFELLLFTRRSNYAIPSEIPFVYCSRRLFKLRAYKTKINDVRLTVFENSVQSARPKHTRGR